MQVIPVLDIKDGVVVLADGGRRETYRPIDTPLCAEGSPSRVVKSLLCVFDFDIFYVADLDAIVGNATNAAGIVALAHAHPTIEFWVDAGFCTVQDLTPYETERNIRFVLGSESLPSLEDYSNLHRDPRLRHHILSLDRKGDIELDPAGLFEQPSLWPDIIISMDLARVGQSAGPNLERLTELRRRRRDLSVVAAGGVRDIDDLLTLTTHGVQYALVATALYNRHVTKRDLERLARVSPQRT